MQLWSLTLRTKEKSRRLVGIAAIANFTPERGYAVRARLGPATRVLRAKARLERGPKASPSTVELAPTGSAIIGKDDVVIL